MILASEINYETRERRENGNRDSVSGGKLQDNRGCVMFAVLQAWAKRLIGSIQSGTQEIRKYGRGQDNASVRT